MIVLISSQKVIQHFSRIFKSILLSLFNIVSHISIRVIRFARKFSRITSADSANQFDFFSIDDEVDNISNQKSNLFIENQIFDHHIESSLLRQESSTEIIHLLREHCEIIFISSAKDSVSSISMMNLILSHQKRQESSSERFFSALDIEFIHRVEEYLTKSFNYLSSQRSSFDSKMNLISNQETFVLLKYSNHLSCSRIFKKYICLSSELIFLFDFDDDVNIRST